MLCCQLDSFISKIQGELRNELIIRVNDVIDFTLTRVLQDDSLKTEISKRMYQCYTI